VRIDAHVHCFPDRLAAAVRNALNREDRLTAGCLLPEVAQQVGDDGFDGAWILPYAHRAGVAEDVNEWSAREVPAHAGLVAGATFHPADDEFARLVHRALIELGLRVVKLHCAVGQFSPLDARLEPLWRAAAGRHVPVLIHAGQRSPGETFAEDLDDIETLLRREPGVPIVLAHSGLPATPRAFELLERYPNLYCDLTPVWERPVPVTAAELERFEGRILFGSDAPNSPMPRKTQAARVEALGASASATAAALGGAAAALLDVRGS
jgi:predicted TIM-barrel fold metal-dependent hydrolase